VKEFPVSDTSFAAAPDITPIEQQPLRMIIAEMLRKAIVSGKLRPGTVLVETALAEQMNVSRAPIREAIQILENDGLVETVAYKGKRVKPLTAREVAETYSLREQFEVFAVRRIIEAGTDASPLWVHCREMEVAAEAGDREGLTDADESFHRTLIQLADHHLLLSFWSGLYLRIHQIMALRNVVQPNLRDIAANHPPIVRALEARDMIAGVALISQHTRSLADFDPASIADLNA
jgi:DNA-binding GntR family transcriptional regulator